ncbi:TetR/AcrR family transcriptional regulator [Streptomyces sp. NPDC041003]|uniref:TetR/AcrR family transcriptional regulator n=1 Tax=Streptomyces sp. NPDC041003 TaxID=3155730 RepID=UPI0033D89CEA
MPLPRFDRLPAERRELILGVARRHFAEHGTEGASYNKIIEAARVSKTAAYHYFDGREDLLTAVLDGVLERLLDALGPWVPARDEADFRSRFAAGSVALAAHLRDHPEDLALADAAIGRTHAGPWLNWFGALVTDGQRLGVIRGDVDHGLLVSVTAAVIRAADAWALARMTTHTATQTETPTEPLAQAADFSEGEASAQLWSLLHGLWGGAVTTAATTAGEDPTDAR